MSGYVPLRVADTGYGWAWGHLESVFSEFSAAHSGKSLKLIIAPAGAWSTGKVH